MEVKVRHAYDQSVDAVFQHFGNKAGVERKFKDLGARNIKVEKCKLTKTSLDLVTSREVPVNAPSLLKKVIGEWNLAKQEEQWTGTAGKSYQGRATISIKGVPVTIVAKMVLASSGKGCTNDVTLTIDSSIPFIGGKLAEFVGQTSATELQKQYAQIKASLKSAAPVAGTAAKATAKAAAKKPASVKPAAKKAATQAAKAPATKSPATKTPAKKTVAAKTAVAKPAAKAVAAKPSVKAAAAKPAAKKAAKAVVKKAAAAPKPVAKKTAAPPKPTAKKAVAKVAAKPAAAKKAAAKKKSK